MKVLLTSTSFQDTPGRHHDKLNALDVDIDFLRGPLSASVILPVIKKYDALICGDDELNRKVLLKGSQTKLKFISKYGVGLDKIDLEAAAEYGIKIKNCLGANHITVAEHVFALLLAAYKNLYTEFNHTKSGNWVRITGNEIYGKTIAIIGLGKIGKEVAIRAKAFGMRIMAFDKNIEKDFCLSQGIKYSNKLIDITPQADIISLNLSLTYETKGIITKEIVEHYMKKGVVIINTARAALLPTKNIIYGLDSKIIRYYLTDVMDIEPIEKAHPLIDYENVLITPHIGSRTFESVERQGLMAVENLEKMIQEFN